MAVSAHFSKIVRQIKTELTSFAALAATAAQAWAEGTLPGGIGTKSSKEWSADAQAMAEAIAVLGLGAIYDTVPEGVAPVTGVANGEFFLVWENERLPIYVNNAGVAVKKAELPTTASLYPTANQRDLFGILAAQVGPMPDTVVIERRRTDFIEYRAFTPMTADGKEWVCWYFSNRFNAGGLGAPALITSHQALLYGSGVLPLPTANQSTGTIAVATTDTKATSDGAVTGSWTAPSTVGTSTDISWPTTAGTGAVRTYTVDNSGGTKGTIFLRGAKSSTNGGIAKVVVRLNGTEISAGLYTCPLVGGERIANYRDNQSTTGSECFIPVCAGVGAGSITIEISESASNPADGRIYDGGLRVYDSFPYNTAGLYGLAELTNGANLLSHAGTSVVYQLTNATRISWKYRTQTVGGIATFKVYNNAGVEISTYQTTSLDTYAGAQSDQTVAIAKGLAKGTYWLRVTVDGTKNAAATSRYALYDLGAVAADETTAGNPLIDPFDVLDCPSNPANSADFGSYQLIGPGNLQFAIQGRIATEAAGVEKFLSGPAHGFETAPSGWALLVDSVNRTADYNALAVGGKLIGSTARVSYSTTLKSPTAVQTLPPTVAGTLDGLPTMGTLFYQDDFSGAGYRFSGTVNWTAIVIIYRDYGIMLQAPSRKPGSKGLGGGFDKLAVSSAGNVSLSSYDNAQGIILKTADSLAMANSSYAIAAKIMNRAEINAALIDLSGNQAGNYNSYSTGYNKGYSDIVPSFSSGRAFPAGSGYTKQVMFRAFKGAALPVALGF